MRNDVVLRLDARRSECSALLRAITPGERSAYEIPGFLHASGLARQCNGDHSNVVLRADALLEAMHQAGCTAEGAHALLAHFQSVVEELWPTVSLTLHEAMRREQASDSGEDYRQVVALCDPRALANWIESATAHAGDVIVAIACARRELHALQVRRAA